MRAPATWALAAIALLGAAACLAAPAFPALSGRVVDQAGILSADTRAELDQMLAAHERAGSNQVVVVTVDSLQGYAIEDYGYQLGRYWGIGREGRDNGVLLIVAPKEREVRIEVGYGLEGALTDVLAHNIIRTVILPRFRAGDMPGGVVAGTRAVLQAIDGAYQPLPERDADTDRAGSFMSLFIFLTIAGEMLARLLRTRRVSAVLLGGGAVLIGWLVLGSLLLGLTMGALVAVFHLMLGAGGGPGGGLPGTGRGGPFYGGGRGGGFGGGFRGGGGSFGGGGASGRW
ncbi:MAG: TPM domain-containing protein [Gammaproteobacteria bacterium]|nr:TPM domain-containing protein [Gammaproteobacteria bacterium]